MCVGLVQFASERTKHLREAADVHLMDGHGASLRGEQSRRAARQAVALYGGHLEESFGLIGLTIDAQEMELSGVGHGPMWFAAGPGCLGRES